MGHSSPTVTANTYADLYADQLDDVAKNMDRIITKTGQKPDKKKIETVRNSKEEADQSWWSRLGSNQRPSACEADALPLSHGTGARALCGRPPCRGRRLARAPGPPENRSPAENRCQGQRTTGFVRPVFRRLVSALATGDDLARSTRM